MMQGQAISVVRSGKVPHVPSNIMEKGIIYLMRYITSLRTMRKITNNMLTPMSRVGPVPEVHCSESIFLSFPRTQFIPDRQQAWSSLSVELTFVTATDPSKRVALGRLWISWWNREARTLTSSWGQATINTPTWSFEASKVFALQGN